MVYYLPFDVYELSSGELLDIGLMNIYSDGYIIEWADIVADVVPEKAKGECIDRILR